jgi:hypothetical protein
MNEKFNREVALQFTFKRLGGEAELTQTYFSQIEIELMAITAPSNRANNDNSK